MANQQQPRPLFRFASMIRPAAAAQPPAPATPAPAPQPLVRPPAATPFRPPAPTTTTTTATTVTTTQPTQPQVPTPQTPATAAPPPPVAVQPRSPPQPRPQPAVTTPRSPLLAPQPQPVAAASPPRRSPSPVVAPKPVVVSPPKVASPRSPPVAAPVPRSPRSPVNNVTRSVPQSPFKRASDVTTVSAPTSTPYSSLPPSPKTKMPESIQDLINQSSSSPSKAPTPPQKVIQPNLVKAQTNSPQIKPAVSHPPSPLKLPPPQLDLESNKIPPQVDQKTVVVQETTMRPNNINGHHHVMQSNRNGSRTVENGKREVIKNDKGVVHHHHKKLSNSDTADDSGMSVLTLAGENKGAIMELSPSRNKYNSPQSLQKKLGSPKAWSSSEDESGTESAKAKKRENKMQNKSQLPMTAFMNSNVQGVNNSILHNASCTHHDPGVHLVFTRKANGNSQGFHIKGSPRS